MTLVSTRRGFLKTLVTGAAALNLPSFPSRAATLEAFSFPILGDIHFDRPQHHDMEWLEREKPDDVRQVRDYTRITSEVLPKLFATVRDTVADLRQAQGAPPAFVLQVGDLVEGLCGNEELALKHNSEAIELIRSARLGVPFLFTKGNHDVTGPGAPDAFKNVFHPFLTAETADFRNAAKVTSARYTVEYGDALFCFFDAYDRESLPWLEAALAKRTSRHCFVVVHPPVVPYGARSTWHVFSNEKDKVQRESLLGLLGENNAFVLGGHIHKYSVLVRTTRGGGRFLQLAISSVISNPDAVPKNLLSGAGSYGPDQVTVEPGFSPATEAQRRAVYETEAPFVKDFQYADQSGYGVVTVTGPRVTARIFQGIGRKVWRELDLSGLLSS